MIQMKLSSFKKHSISRSNPPHKTQYSDYRPFLRRDFCCRCAYCNLKDSSITTPFEVDHFIPRAIFSPKRIDLETDYNNLVYACKKCNNAKSSKFQGDITLDNPVNEQFYDPVITDYNLVFYRNEFGVIASDDEKGKRQIVDLKLYRPIHALGWLCEELSETASRLEYIISTEQNVERREKYKAAYDKINEKYRKLSRLFIASYNDNKFDFPVASSNKVPVAAGK